MGSRMRIALIASPFVGPATWRLTAPHLPDAEAIDYGGVCAPDWYDGAAARIIAQVDSRPWQAVLHSSAGAFAPALAAKASHLKGFIFVDAVLPHPGRSAAEMAPAGQMEQLRAITRDGLLARWSRWFPAGVLEAWLPDELTRTAVFSEIPRVPFAFLEAKLSESRLWEALPASFLTLSDEYDRNGARARDLGWPVARLPLTHLGMLSHPAEVAAEIVRLSGRMN